MLRTRLFVSHEIASAIDDFFVFGCCASGFAFASKIAQSFTIFFVGWGDTCLRR